MRASPVSILEPCIAESKKAIDEYVAASDCFRRIYFDLGASSETIGNNDSQKENAEINGLGIVSDGIRKLFKLVSALNIPLGH